MFWKVAKATLIISVVALAVTSCVTEETDYYPQEVKAIPPGDPMVLGRKLVNPYSVTNMKVARELLQLQYPEAEELKIRPTHLYVRFLPADEAQYDRLKKDSCLKLFDHPLDHEITVPGDYYRDPHVPASRPTYQYASIPLTYTPPSGIVMEILEQLYLPASDTVAHRRNGRVRSQTEEMLLALEETSLAASENNEDDAYYAYDPSTSTESSGSRWVPAGSVTVWDNRLNRYIPVQGVKVRSRRWFTVHEAITDVSGNFRMNDSFRRAAHYSIIWERDRFDIRSGTFGQAHLNGPKIRGDWRVRIDRDGIDFHYAHVFRAAFRYYYGDIGGLKRPTFRMKYSVFDKKGNHSATNLGNWSVFGINPNILIYRYNSSDGSENDADEMFSTTCHETAHSTHLQCMNGGAVQYCQVSEIIRESWAIGIEWFITQKEYKEKGIANYGDPGYNVAVTYPARHGFQYWNSRRSQTLTSLFIDIVDPNNQQGQSFGGFLKGTVDDRISGYTFSEIESSFLHEIYGIGSLSAHLKGRKPPEITDAEIDRLMEYF